MKYHKIQSVYKRDPENNHKTFIEGDFSLPEFKELANHAWEFTEKVDGTNIRIYWDGDSVWYEGRNENSQIPTHLTEALDREINQRLVKQTFGSTPVVMYGEGYGPKIQKVGHKYRDDNSFVLFDVNIGGTWIERDKLREMAHSLNLEIVPVIGSGTLYEMVECCREGFYSQWGDFEAEGIIAKPEGGFLNRLGNRIITKCKCRDFQETK